jgi:DNA-binding response OmpR family regulator/DNA-binding CsgD family transcriptional regulator
MSEPMTDETPPGAGPARQDIILVVDDSPESLGFLTDALDRAGLTVLVATDGAGALDLIDHVVPDLILLDAVMPGLDGFETCRRLKRHGTGSHLPVIFMTALSETEHIVAGLSAGGVDYVTKPIVVDELLARIRVHLANARVTYGARAALDVTGRCLLAVDGAGTVLWSTPQTETLLGAGGVTLAPGDRLPPVLRDGLDGVRAQLGLLPGRFTIPAGSRSVEFSYVGETQPNEFLYRLVETGPGGREMALKEAFGLTAREAEVLLWIAGGKSNRDIAEILAISARTVNKHLEQIFTKLGVENRASAAALAVETLLARG